jgi:gamma-glutamyltranspeptidase / glutathione hydrolase
MKWRSRALETAAAFAAVAALALGACGAPPPVTHPVPSPLPRPSATQAVRPVPPAPAPGPQPLTAQRFGVVAEHGQAADVAMAVLERGGSAADAAVAGILAAGVAQPVSSGLGGGGFALYWDAAAARAVVIDFRETAPGGIDPTDYDADPTDRKRGVLVGVPGEVAGLAEIHRRWGKLPLGELFRPAADLADGGFEVSHHLHRSLRWSRDWLLRSPLAAVLAPEGALLSHGDVAKNPKLAATLRRLAAEGAAAFYQGTIAADVVDTAHAAGSKLGVTDLARYRAVERAPLVTRWEGMEVLAPPPPAAGGLLLAETLTMHDKAALVQLGYGSGAYLHVLAETFRGAVADRVRALGDPDYVKMDLTRLTAPARMKARRARISLEKTSTPESFQIDDGGTSSLVVVDADGNVAIVSSSLNHMFGARLVTAGGFALNDQLAAFDSQRIDALFGGPRRPNGPIGGARPVASLTPVLVVRDGHPILALAGSGGSGIPTAVAQALLARIAFGKTAADSVADVRIDAPATGGLRIDPRAAPELVADLRARGELVDADRPNFSAVSFLGISVESGVTRFDAAFDPRKGGAALTR